MRKLVFLVLLFQFIFIDICLSEDDKNLKFSGYMETYFTYDIFNPETHYKPGYVYSYNRNNEVNINLALAKIEYKKEYIKVNMAFMLGTYTQANLLGEPELLRNIYEANIGVKLSDLHNFWLEAGVLSSHIGFESAIGKDCWTLTRSLISDDVPFFETGAKLSYTTDDNLLTFSGLILNGWQRIEKLEGNYLPSFGHQIILRPLEGLTINSGSFIGNDKPDSVSQMRFFHDFYIIYQITNDFGVTFSYGLGLEEDAPKSKKYNIWHTPLLICRYSINEKINIAGRLEYFYDKNCVIVPQTNTANGFQTFGYSVNIDYKIYENILWRIEARGFSSKDNIFRKGNLYISQNYNISTSLSVWF